MTNVKSAKPPIKGEAPKTQSDPSPKPKRTKSHRRGKTIKTPVVKPRKCQGKENPKPEEIPKRKRGRPVLLNPEVQDTIVTAIRAGNYIETAAAAAGISKETLYDWLRQGAKAKEGKFKDFSDSVQKAMADSEMREVSVLDHAMGGGATISKRVTETVTEKKGGDTITKTVTEETIQPPQWQPAAWRLERKHPEKYGQRQRIDANLNHSGSVTIVVKTSDQDPKVKTKLQQKKKDTESVKENPGV